MIACKRPAGVKKTIRKRPAGRSWLSFPQKRRDKRRKATPTQLEDARDARARAKRIRKRHAATGILYTPTDQVRGRSVRRGRTSKTKRFTLDESKAMKEQVAFELLVKLGFLEDKDWSSFRHSFQFVSALILILGM